MFTVVIRNLCPLPISAKINENVGGGGQDEDIDDVEFLEDYDGGDLVQDDIDNVGRVFNDINWYIYFFCVQ